MRGRCPLAELAGGVVEAVAGSLTPLLPPLLLLEQTAILGHLMYVMSVTSLEPILAPYLSDPPFGLEPGALQCDWGECALSHGARPMVHERRLRSGPRQSRCFLQAVPPTPPLRVLYPCSPTRSSLHRKHALLHRVRRHRKLHCGPCRPFGAGAAPRFVLAQSLRCIPLIFAPILPHFTPPVPHPSPSNPQPFSPHPQPSPDPFPARPLPHPTIVPGDRWTVCDRPRPLFRRACTNLQQHESVVGAYVDGLVHLRVWQCFRYRDECRTHRSCFAGGITAQPAGHVPPQPMPHSEMIYAPDPSIRREASQQSKRRTRSPRCYSRRPASAPSAATCWAARSATTLASARRLPASVAHTSCCLCSSPTPTLGNSTSGDSTSLPPPSPTCPDPSHDPIQPHPTAPRPNQAPRHKHTFRPKQTFWLKHPPVPRQGTLRSPKTWRRLLPHHITSPRGQTWSNLLPGEARSEREGGGSVVVL